MSLDVDYTPKQFDLSGLTGIILDYPPAERPRYIEAFFANIATGSEEGD
jgi:hypothetical protein